MKYKYIDLFSGVGGFRLAVERACNKTKNECECVGFSEIDRFAVKTYKSNFEVGTGETEFGDIKKIDVESVPDIDFLFAGFPCQPFSLMGKKKGFADTRGTMFFYIEKILSEKKPRFFILENVRGLITHDKGKTHKEIVRILENKLGYKTKTWVLNSKDFGVPQVRRRVYIVGFLNHEEAGRVNPPEPFLSKKYLSTWHLLDKEVNLKYYLSEKLLKIILAHGSGKFKSKSEINQLIARPLTATMHKMHRACQDNYFSNRFIYGAWNEDNNSIILNNKRKNNIRRITPLEAFRIQGFPDSFVKNAQISKVSDTQLYRQAGNAITVSVAEEVIKNILNSLNSAKQVTCQELIQSEILVSP